MNNKLVAKRLQSRTASESKEQRFLHLFLADQLAVSNPMVI